MTYRVLLGQKGSTMGLWVSKPGYSVLTAADDDMMLSTDEQALQVSQSGSIVVGNADGFPFTINIPNMGYRPVVKLFPYGCTVYYTFNSNTQFVIRQSPGTGNHGVADADRYVKYQVLGLLL